MLRPRLQPCGRRMSSLRAPPLNTQSLADPRQWDNPSVNNSPSLAQPTTAIPSIFQSPIIQDPSIIAPFRAPYPPLLPNNTDHPITGHKVRQHQAQARQHPLQSDHSTHSNQSGPRRTMIPAPRIKRARPQSNAPSTSITQHRLPRAPSSSPKQDPRKLQMHQRIFRLS